MSKIQAKTGSRKKRETKEKKMEGKREKAGKTQQNTREKTAQYTTYNNGGTKYKKNK